MDNTRGHFKRDYEDPFHLSTTNNNNITYSEEFQYPTWQYKELIKQHRINLVFFVSHHQFLAKSLQLNYIQGKQVATIMVLNSSIY